VGAGRLLLPRLDTWRCWACGGANDESLGLRFSLVGPGRVTTEFSVAPNHVGVDGVAHGGLLATVFDDAMAWALIAAHRQLHFTVEMGQRFLRPTPTDRPLVVEAAATGAADGRLDVEARLWEADRPDRLLATAWGRYARVPDEVHSRLPAAQVAEFEQLVRLLEDVAAADGGGG
jgi:acyl-coenzyme A thioesterase PaaI-like protein